MEVVNLTARAAEHPEIRATLERAGWCNDYHFDAGDWVQALRRDGFSVVPAAVHALSEVGNLTLLPPRHGGAVFGSGPIIMEPLFAATGEAPRIRLREMTLGLPLCPVGEWSGEYVLLVGGDGSVYAETTFQFLRLGDDFADALRLMILREIQPREIV